MTCGCGCMSLSDSMAREALPGRSAPGLWVPGHRPGPVASPAARPSHVQAVSPGLHSASWVFPPLACSGPSMDRDLGTSPHSSQWGIWGWSRQAGMRGQRADKGAKEEALSQASLFSSPTGPGHGPVSGWSPGTGALTPEVPPSPGHHREIQPRGGGGRREVRETLGDRSGGEPTKTRRTTRGLPCPPRMQGLQGLAVKAQVTSSS